MATLQVMPDGSLPPEFYASPPVEEAPAPAVVQPAATPSAPPPGLAVTPVDGNPELRRVTIGDKFFIVASKIKPSVRFQMYVLAGKDVTNHMVMLTLQCVMQITGMNGAGLAPPTTPAQLSARLDALGDEIVDFLMAEQVAKLGELAAGADENAGLKEVAKN